jgi:hypothetical protein
MERLGGVSVKTLEKPSSLRLSSKFFNNAASKVGCVSALGKVILGN